MIETECCFWRSVLIVMVTKLKCYGPENVVVCNIIPCDCFCKDLINKHIRRPGGGSKLKMRREDDTDNGPFDHPVYKKLSRLNGDINKMTKDELKARLESLHLDSR